MNKNYFELIARPSSNIELFSDLLLSFADAIEEKDGSLIIRSDEQLEEIAFGIEEFAKKLSQKLGYQVSVKISLEEKPNEDWIKKYQDSVPPVQAG